MGNDSFRRGFGLTRSTATQWLKSKGANGHVRRWPASAGSAVDPQAALSQDRFIMAKRLYFVALCVASCIPFAAPAGAQQTPFRLFGGGNSPFPKEQGGNEGNPARHQKMIEADKSQQAGDFPHVIEITDAILQQNPRDAAAFY